MRIVHEIILFVVIMAFNIGIAAVCVLLYDFFRKPTNNTDHE